MSLNRRKGSSPYRPWSLSLIPFILLALGGILFLGMRGFYPIRYDKAVEAACSESGLDRALVYAVIRVESGFDPMARSTVGAVGLMQIMPNTGAWAAAKIGIPYSVASLTNPGTNIRIGCFYLRYLLDQFGGDETTALAAYNGGIGNVKDWLGEGKAALDLGDIRFAETRRFVQLVGRDRTVYRLLYPGYFRQSK